MKSPLRVRLGPVAIQVLNYLSTHPNAQDTVEGIGEWWLLEQRVRSIIGQVKNALAELVVQEMVIERTGQDGRVHYRLNARKQRTVERLLRGRALLGGKSDFTNWDHCVSAKVSSKARMVDKTSKGTLRNKS